MIILYLIYKFEEHLQLLYGLIAFMGIIIKNKKDNCKKDQTKVNEINQIWWKKQ